MVLHAQGPDILKTKHKTAKTPKTAKAASAKPDTKTAREKHPHIGSMRESVRLDRVRRS